MNNFLNQMQIASLTSQIDCECHIKHCKVVKVLLPTEVINELKKQATKVVMLDALMSDTIVTFMGIPVEEDKTTTNVRYVIEGELSL